MFGSVTLSLEVACSLESVTTLVIASKNGIRQNDPLSPVLLNIVADILAMLIEHVKVDGQIKDQSFNMQKT